VPEVFSVGPALFSIVRVGLVLAALTFVYVSGRVARTRGTDGKWSSGVAEASVFLGLLGARAGFVGSNWSAYREEPWTALYFWQPGYSLYAGVLTGLVYVVWRLWKRRTPDRAAQLSSFASSFALAALVFGAVSMSTRMDLNSDVLQAGDQVPDFRLQTLAGEAVSFASLEGRTVVLNFWATWCPPCRREMPLLDEFQREYGPKGVTVVGVNLNEPRPTVRRYVESVGVTYPIWTDGSNAGPELDSTQNLFARFRGVGLPTTVFVDSERVVRSSLVGELNRGILQSRVNAMLPP
jgi:cytochrome c biogenesis protein CcmG/thiol:disulfide interchange protein DsbE